MRGDSWTIRLSAATKTDYRQILRWTAENFGPAQALIHVDTISSALKEPGAGPAIPGVKESGEIGAHIRTLHFGRNSRNGQHFVLFQVSSFEGREVIDVLRLLHDSMDLERHRSPTELEHQTLAEKQMSAWIS